MEEAQKMLVANKKKWCNQVRVIALSIDQDKARCKAHIEGPAQLTEFEHYNVKSNACNAIPYFGVKQIPLCVLVDKEGKIAFIGHPTWRRIDEDINGLLKGKKLTGRGTTSLASQRE